MLELRRPLDGPISNLRCAPLLDDGKCEGRAAIVRRDAAVLETGAPDLRVY